MITVFVRTIFIFFALVFSMRLTGKRQIGELQISELVVTLMLSELAVLPIADRGVPVSHALVPILLLLSLEVIISFLETKSNVMKKIFGGEPAFLIRRGVIDSGALARHRIEIEELLSELRLAGVFDVAEVRYAILEENGRISVRLNADKCPATAGDVGAAAAERGITRSVVIDGEPDKRAAAALGLTEKELSGKLRSLGVAMRDVFLLVVDDAYGFTLYKKEPDGSVSSVSGDLKDEEDI